MTSPTSTALTLGQVFSIKLPALLESILPDPVMRSRFLRSAWTAVQSVPGLANCRPTSFVSAVAQAAQLRLEVGTATQQAWILPYKGAAKLIVGARGMSTLARRAGVLDLQSEVVYVDEVFRAQKGARPDLHHEIALTPREGVDVLGAYAIAWQTGVPHPTFVWLPIADLLKRRGSSEGYRRSPESSPWTQWPIEMYRKSAIRALFPQLPSDEQLLAAVELDNRADGIAPTYSPALDEGIAAEAEAKAAADAAAVRDRLAEMRGSTAQVAP
jgi:recombination protein RecT